MNESEYMKEARRLLAKVLNAARTDAILRHIKLLPIAEAALLSHIAKGEQARTECGNTPYDEGPFTLEQARAVGDGVVAVPAHTGGESRIYVTCHQCDNCQHIGINDEHPTEAACNRGACGWHGPAPTEDRCPGCGEVGTMSTACPECGGHYVLLADADLVRATTTAGQQARGGEDGGGVPGTMKTNQENRNG